MAQAEDDGATPESVFKLFDADGDGHITALELKSALAELGEKVSEAEAAKRIQGGDADGDRKISLAEFTAMMKA